MNQTTVLALKAGIAKSRADWAADPKNEGEPVVAIQLHLLEELVDDLIAANETNVMAIEAREKADERARTIVRSAVKRGGRKK